MDLTDAVRAGDLKTLRELLAAEADPNATGESGLTPLGAAAESGRVDVVKTLVKAGAEVNAETADPTGKARRGEPVRPMLVAGLAGHWKAYQFLALRTRKPFRNAALRQLKNRHVSRSRKRGTQPLIRALHQACETGDAETVAELIAAGVDVNAGDEHWGTPVIGVAAVKGHAEVVRLLLQAGADPNGPIGDDFPSLMYATTAEVGEVLLAAGADPNLYSLRGGIDTPLISACRMNQHELASVLIQAGADMNVVGGVQGCALSEAISHKADAAARLLIASGADVNLRPKNGWPPLLHAAYRGRESLVVALLDAGADVLCEARDTSLGDPDDPMETAISLAFEQGHAGIVETLQKAMEVAKTRSRIVPDDA